MAQAELTISSKNYSSWSLRGWLLCRMAGLDFREVRIALDDPDQRQELLLLSPSVLVPRLTHDGVTVWDTLAIAEYLHEIKPRAGLLPKDQRRARPLPRRLRRDAFRLLQSALGAADESEGAPQGVQDLFRRAARCRAHQGDLDGVPGDLWRALAVRRQADGRGRHVCAGLHALPHLCDRARSRPAGLLRPHLRLAAAAPNGARAPPRSPTR